MRVCLWHAQLQARVARVAATSKTWLLCAGFCALLRSRLSCITSGPQRLVHRFLCDLRGQPKLSSKLSQLDDKEL